MKVNYNIKFYKAHVLNANDEIFNFYLAERTPERARDFVAKYVSERVERYHLFPPHDSFKVSVTEVGIDNYGREDGYNVIN